MSGDDQPTNLGDFELFVMLAVVRIGEEAYSRTIREAIEERTGRRVARGALYVTLDRLRDKGFLRSWKGEPRAERGGKARRHYEVTPEGLEAVRTSQAMIRSMWEGLDEAIAGA